MNNLHDKHKEKLTKRLPEPTPFLFSMNTTLSHKCLMYIFYNILIIKSITKQLHVNYNLFDYNATLNNEINLPYLLKIIN